MHAECDIVMANSSLCLSHFCIVSKRIHISSNSFHHLVGGMTLVFLSTTAVTKFQGELPQRNIKYTEWKKLWFLREIAVYFGNGTS